MSTMTPVSPDDPLMIAWTAYKSTEDFSNSLKWAMAYEYSAGRPIAESQRVAHAEGSLWAAFMQGFKAASGSGTPATPSQPETYGDPWGGPDSHGNEPQVTTYNPPLTVCTAHGKSLCGICYPTSMPMGLGTNFVQTGDPAQGPSCHHCGASMPEGE